MTRAFEVFLLVFASISGLALGLAVAVGLFLLLGRLVVVFFSRGGKS